MVEQLRALAQGDAMAAAARPSQVPTGAMGAALQQSLLDAQVQNEIAPAAVASTEDEAVAARKRARQEADPAAHRRGAIIEGILKTAKIPLELKKHLGDIVTKYKTKIMNHQNLTNNVSKIKGHTSTINGGSWPNDIKAFRIQVEVPELEDRTPEDLQRHLGVQQDRPIRKVKGICSWTTR